MATVVVMPRLSPTMEEGVLAKWSKNVGDKIAPGDVIAEVETDKANMDFPLEEEGVLLKLLVKEGATVKLGEPVAIIGAAGENPDSAAPPAPSATAEAPSVKAEAPSVKADAPVAKPAAAPSAKTEAPSVKADAPPANGRVKASPLARKIADERGVDLASVAGSGPGGRVVKRDVEGATPTPAGARAPEIAFTPGVDETIAASPMRKTIARRLVEAKREVPHIYLVADATCDRLMALRAEMNAAAADGVKISVNDLVVKALALALRRVPEANVSWNDKDASLTRHGRVDIGIAVSLPDGLITPVVRHADQRSISQLSTEIRALAERGRIKKLKPEEYTGGTATVTNLGMFGVREFSAIINPPEAVILAVGATEKRAIVVDDQVRVAQRMTLTLSCDHRVVDGVLGARLLAEIVRLLENPVALVM